MQSQKTKITKLLQNIMLQITNQEITSDFILTYLKEYHINKSAAGKSVALDSSLYDVLNYQNDGVYINQKIDSNYKDHQTFEVVTANTLNNKLKYNYQIYLSFKRTSYVEAFKFLAKYLVDQNINVCGSVSNIHCNDSCLISAKDLNDIKKIELFILKEIYSLLNQPNPFVPQYGKIGLMTHAESHPDYDYNLTVAKYLEKYFNLLSSGKIKQPSFLSLVQFMSYYYGDGKPYDGRDLFHQLLSIQINEEDTKTRNNNASRTR